MNFMEWIATLTPDSINIVSGKIGMSASTLYRQIETNVQPATAVKIARAYNGSPIEGLVAARLITADEAADTPDRLRLATNAELLTELGRRLDAVHARKN